MASLETYAHKSPWRWIHPEKRRWYTLILTLDLFGEWELIRCWGALDSRRGGQIREFLDDPEDIEQIIDGIDRRRRQRGYIPVET
ncbi:MAG: WGR domain-containing protein [Methylothermaceae bacterium]|nr:WGR domain-containing protein [Methylothermaceae bacterium]